MYCSNPNCPNPLNSPGSQECAACHTPITYRYLWAVGSDAANVQPGELVGDRYLAVSPQVWLDTRPRELPYSPEELPDYIIPYLFLYSHRLHTPEVYGFHQLEETREKEILLLKNVPVDSSGHLRPSLLEAWPMTSAVRQVYWLWQMMQLWWALSEYSEYGVASSLLTENLRVDGWRVRLLQLDMGNYRPTLENLLGFWSDLIDTAQPSVQQPLQDICQQMVLGEPDELWNTIASQLNQLLLEEAARLPLELEVAGATDVGQVRSHNEDSCYPTEADLQQSNTPPHNQLIPHLAVICDGVGGHEGGEVASQLGVENLKQLVQHLLIDVTTQEELVQPEIVSRQLEEIILVVNNAIAAKNDEQGREWRQRMGTTLVMALQLPQNAKTSANYQINNGHELYVAHVGDSRAYWLTEDSCMQLTVDDDVASREVMQGRSLHWEALLRHDSGSLTQAMGTRDGDFIHPTVQRFVIEENGLLLLCSDGLSDNDWLEEYWGDRASAILNDELSLEAGVQSLVDLANEKNGHDNISVVLVRCRVSPQKLVLADTDPQPDIDEAKNSPVMESKMSEASKALLYDEAVAEPELESSGGHIDRKQWILVAGLLGFLLLAGSLALWRNWENLQKTPEDFPYPWETPVSPEVPAGPNEVLQ